MRIPDATPLEGLTTDEGEVTLDTVFGWSATEDRSHYVRIDLFSLDDEGVVTEVDCLAEDDGEFTLPALTQAQLEESFTATATLTRLGITALRNGDALLVVTRESESAPD